MNTHDPLNDSRWHDLIARARTDTPPAVDVAALVREVRAAAATPTTWWTELAALFEIRGAAPICLAAICLLAALAFWQAWQTWEQVSPWAGLLLSQNVPTSALPL